jgi:D-beta-D-heptose 7-phosphate kinase / D-beta-D-heptose 1-phosphate adenosyltransferase
VNPEHLLTFISQFADIRILVIGDAMLDVYLRGTSGRLCREAPVPIVDLDKRQELPGGAANTALNVRGLGAQTTLLSVVGDDNEGNAIRHLLAECGVDTGHVVRSPLRHTLAKHRVVGSSQLLVRFDAGTTTPVSQRTERVLQSKLHELFPQHDAVIISDYGYGVLTPGLVETLAGLQSGRPRLIVVDAKNLQAYSRVGVSAVKPNYSEAVKLLGLEQRETVRDRAEQIAGHERKLLELTGAQIAAVTLDTEGALVFESNRPPYRTYARPRPHSRAAGAGDTFTSVLALALAAGAHTPAASELASAAAAVVVGKEGTSVCSASELSSYIFEERKVVTEPTAFQARLAFYRERGQRIVFTNGCFDILHRGHITYLSQSKSLGDILIVGLNSDGSVQRLKGAERPINNLEDRAQVLAALSCVDHVVPFEEDTPSELIRLVRPDIFVKGGDYTRETLPEASLVEALGGEVYLMPYVSDRSTSGIIERIRRVEPPQPIHYQAGAWTL